MTVSAANRRATKKYLEKNYEQLAIRIPKEMARQFKEKCIERGESQAGILKEAIKLYLDS